MDHQWIVTPQKGHVQTNGATLQDVGVTAGGDASAQQLQPAVVGHFGQRGRGVAQIGNQGGDVVHHLWSKWEE